MDIQSDIVTQGASIRLELQIGSRIKRERSYLLDNILPYLKRGLMDARSDPDTGSFRVQSFLY